MDYLEDFLEKTCVGFTLEIFPSIPVQVLPVIPPMNFQHNSSRIPLENPTILAEIFQAFPAPTITRMSPSRISGAIPARTSTEISSEFSAEMTGKIRRRIYETVHKFLRESQKDILKSF